MAKYQLLAPHFLYGTLVPEGTVVGDGTVWPIFNGPSFHMVGLDEEGEKLCAERRKTFGRVGSGVEPGAAAAIATLTNIRSESASMARQLSSAELMKLAAEAAEREKKAAGTKASADDDDDIKEPAKKPASTGKGTP